MVVAFAATGDEGFDGRRNRLSVPLAARGIASILLEMPFYGLRRPEGQEGPKVRHVSDACAWLLVACLRMYVCVICLCRHGGARCCG